MREGIPTDSASAAGLARFTTSLLSDVRGGGGVVAPGLMRFAGTGTQAGKAVTARCEEGSLHAVFAALDHARPGDFLCIQGGGETAYLGDLLAGNLVQRGLAGAIVDGYVRDRSALAGLPLTILARGVTPRNMRRQGGGEAQVPLVLGSVAIQPGDWIVADDDGAIVIAPAEVEMTLASAVRQERVEVRIRDLVRAGTRMPDAVRRAMSEVA